MSTHSKACCTIPPVVVDDYQHKGEYVDFNGTKTYITGPKDAETAILSIYDIFGFWSQTLQGADILAYSNKDRKTMVIIPDFFNGNPCKSEWYPPDNEEKQHNLGAWFQTVSPPDHLPRIPAFLAEAEKINPHIKTWGVIGYCWGGKMASLIAGNESKFKAALQSSPAMVDAEDGTRAIIPMAILASEDENGEDIKKYGDNLKVPKYVEIFKGMSHGWMSSRTNVKDDKVKAEYERGYKIALEFFHEHL